MSRRQCLPCSGSTPEHVQAGAPIPADLNEFNRQTIVRISNSIDAKCRKYMESYSGLSHVKDRPFVLTVSAFDKPFARLTCQRAIEAVLFGYYVDEEWFLREGGALQGHRSESGERTTGARNTFDIFPRG